MIISNFIHIIDGKAWDAINKAFIPLNKDSINYIVKNKNETSLKNIPKELIDKKIVLLKEEHQKYIDNLIEKTSGDQIQGLYLITTTACNLDCDYCFYRSSISNSLKNKKNMTFSVAKKAIDKYQEIVKDNKKDNNYWQQITFYGGEPMINKELLLKAIPYAKQKFPDSYTDLVINTNLTLLDNDLIKLFKDNNVQVQVSIDGNKPEHDKHRKTIDGKGTYDAVINNIKKLVKHNIDVLPMVTANDSNVENLSKILYDIVYNLDINKFNVNILISNTYSVDSEYPKVLANEMIKAYTKFGEKAKDLSFESLYDTIINQTKIISKNDCGTTRKITVFPDGKVYRCQALEKMKENYFGTIDENFKIDNTHWSARNRFKNEKCLNCPVIASCGGGCALGSYNYSGSIYGIDYNNCEYTKAIFKNLIENQKNSK